jgi:hypothetical protein
MAVFAQKPRFCGGCKSMKPQSDFLVSGAPQKQMSLLKK